MSQKNKTNTEVQKPKKNKNTTEITPVEKNYYTGEIITCILAIPTIFTLVSLSAYYFRFFSKVDNIQEDFFTGALGYKCAQILNNFFGIISFYIPIGIVVFVIIFFLKKKFWEHLFLNTVNFIMLLPFLAMVSTTFSSDEANLTGNFLYNEFFKKHIGPSNSQEGLES